MCFFCFCRCCRAIDAQLSLCDSLGRALLCKPFLAAAHVVTMLCAHFAVACPRSRAHPACCLLSCPPLTPADVSCRRIVGSCFHQEINSAKAEQRKREKEVTKDAANDSSVEVIDSEDDDDWGILSEPPRRLIVLSVQRTSM